MKTNNRSLLSTVVLIGTIALCCSLNVSAAPQQQKMKSDTGKMQSDKMKMAEKKKMMADKKMKSKKMADKKMMDDKMKMDTAGKM